VVFYLKALPRPHRQAVQRTVEQPTPPGEPSPGPHTYRSTCMHTCECVRPQCSGGIVYRTTKCMQPFRKQHGFVSSAHMPHSSKWHKRLRPSGLRPPTIFSLKENTSCNAGFSAYHTDRRYQAASHGQPRAEVKRVSFAGHPPRRLDTRRGVIAHRWAQELGQPLGRDRQGHPGPQ
jgi:hypothetical protein